MVPQEMSEIMAPGAAINRTGTGPLPAQVSGQQFISEPSNEDKS